MNILFIGQYKTQHDGWTEATTDYIKALQSVGANITIRNIYMANSRGPADPQILPLENTKYDHYDILIQKVLPHLYYYDGRFKISVGMMVFESEMKFNSSLNRCNLLDKILVPSVTEAYWLRRKIQKPVSPVSEAVDINKYKQNYRNLDAKVFGRLFTFLAVAENSTRKNLEAIIRAYLSEFSINDNVCLVIKTSQNITERIQNIRRNLRRFYKEQKYPTILLLSNKISNDDMMSLYQHSDVFVSASKGEAFCRPIIHSLGFNKPIITTNLGSITDYLSTDVGWLVRSDAVPCYAPDPPLPHFYTADELWAEPSISSLMYSMRSAYKNKDLYTHYVDNIKSSNIIEQFSYKSVGSNIIKALINV